MSTNDALRAFGDIDDRYIREAEAAEVRRLPRVLTLVACAAVMVLTLGFAFEQWVLPSITAGTPAHLCVTIPDPEKTELGLYRRIVDRLQYDGRWYRRYDSADFKSTGCGRELGEVYTAVDCPFCTPENDGIHDVAGTLYEVNGFDPAFMLCLHRTYGRYELYIIDEEPYYENGEALFENALHLRDLTYAVRFEKSMDVSDDTRYILPMSDPVWEPFLQALVTAEVTDDPETKALSSFEVTLYLQNGASVRLSLTRGGYVEWRGHAFAIDKDVYDAFTARLSEIMQQG